MTVVLLGKTVHARVLEMSENVLARARRRDVAHDGHGDDEPESATRFRQLERAHQEEAVEVLLVAQGGLEGRSSGKVVDQCPMGPSGPAAVFFQHVVGWISDHGVEAACGEGLRKCLAPVERPQHLCGALVADRGAVTPHQRVAAANVVREVAEHALDRWINLCARGRLLTPCLAPIIAGIRNHLGWFLWVSERFEQERQPGDLDRARVEVHPEDVALQDDLGTNGALTIRIPAPQVCKRGDEKRARAACGIEDAQVFFQ